MAKSSYLDLRIDDFPEPSTEIEWKRPTFEGFKPQAPANTVRLWGNSAISLDKVAMHARFGRWKHPKHVRLRLHAGTVLCFMRDLPSGSDCEIVFAAGRVKLEPGVYDINSTGEVAVGKGKACVKLGDMKECEIPQGFRFDAKTGELLRLPENVFHGYERAQ